MSFNKNCVYSPPGINHQGNAPVPTNKLEETVPVNGTKSPRSQWNRLETGRVVITDISVYGGPVINNAVAIPDSGECFDDTVECNFARDTQGTIAGFSATAKDGPVKVRLIGSSNQRLIITLNRSIPIGVTGVITYDGTGNLISFQDNIKIAGFKIPFTCVE